MGTEFKFPGPGTAMAFAAAVAVGAAAYIYSKPVYVYFYVLILIYSDALIIWVLVGLAVFFALLTLIIEFISGPYRKDTIYIKKEELELIKKLEEISKNELVTKNNNTKKTIGKIPEKILSNLLKDLKKKWLRIL